MKPRISSNWHGTLVKLFNMPESHSFTHSFILQIVIRHLLYSRHIVLGTGEAEMNKSDKNCLSDSLCSNGGDKEPTRKQSETVIDREVMSPILGKECHQWLKLGAWEGLGAGGGVLHRMGKESLAEGMASGRGGRSYKEVAKWETGGRVFQAAGTASAKAPRRDVRAVTGKQTEATESWGARRYGRREAGAQSKGIRRP